MNPSGRNLHIGAAIGMPQMKPSEGTSAVPLASSGRTTRWRRCADLGMSDLIAACACVASNHYSFAATSSVRVPLVEVAGVEPRASKLRRECGPPAEATRSPPTCPETRTPWGLTG